MEKDCETCVHKDKPSFSATCVECGFAMMNYEHIPFTNADRIRSMTDEELACFINEIEAEAIKRAGRYLTKTEIERGKAQRLDWLKQEATDGKQNQPAP